MPYHYSAGIFAIGLLLVAYDIYLMYYKGFRRSIIPIIGYIALIISSFIYVISFLSDDFMLIDVYKYSSSSESLIIKLSSSWSSNGGFIIWWVMLTAIFLLLHRIIVSTKSHDDENAIGYRRYFTLSNMVVLVLGASIYTTNSFRTFEECCGPVDGLGLNPLLRNYWNTLHPPFVLLGYSLTVLAAVAALSHLRSREVNLYSSLAWLTVSIANIVGGLWAYNTLGWGGYWAWDPVETALLMPWLALTGYFHLIYMDPKFRNSILSLAGFSVFFSAYITRGGVYSPLHGFSGVSTTGIFSMAIGLPFLFYAFNVLQETDFERVRKVLDDVYEGSLTISGLAIMGIYTVLLVVLGSQSIYTIFTEKELAVDIVVYNYLSFPFVALFLVFFPGCMLYRYFRNIDEYLRKLVGPSIIGSGIFSLASPYTGINWSPLSTINTNMIISFLLPLSLLALLATLYGLVNIIMTKFYRDLGLKILHIAVPMMMLAILISGPYSYNQQYFTDVLAERGVPIDLGGLQIVYKGAEFKGLVNKVAIPSSEPMPNLPAIPEEAQAVLYFEVIDGGSRYTVSETVRFNIGNVLKGYGGVLVEPLILSDGIDECYIIPSPMSAADLIYLYGKHAYLFANTSESETERFVYSHIPLLLAQVLNMDPELFKNHTLAWNPETALIQNGVMISYKRVPLMKLLYVSFAFLVIGEVILILDRWVIRHFLTKEVGEG